MHAAVTSASLAIPHPCPPHFPASRPSYPRRVPHPVYKCRSCVEQIPFPSKSFMQHIELHSTRSQAAGDRETVNFRLPLLLLLLLRMLVDAIIESNTHRHIETQRETLSTRRFKNACFPSVVLFCSQPLTHVLRFLLLIRLFTRSSRSTPLL